MGWKNRKRMRGDVIRPPTETEARKAALDWEDPGSGERLETQDTRKEDTGGGPRRSDTEEKTPRQKEVRTAKETGTETQTHQQRHKAIGGVTKEKEEGPGAAADKGTTQDDRRNPNRRAGEGKVTKGKAEKERERSDAAQEETPRGTKEHTRSKVEGTGQIAGLDLKEGEEQERTGSGGRKRTRDEPQRVPKDAEIRTGKEGRNGRRPQPVTHPPPQDGNIPKGARGGVPAGARGAGWGQRTTGTRRRGKKENEGPGIRGT